jgi:hypothetical protein
MAEAHFGPQMEDTELPALKVIGKSKASTVRLHTCRHACKLTGTAATSNSGGFWTGQLYDSPSHPINGISPQTSCEDSTVLLRPSVTCVAQDKPILPSITKARRNWQRSGSQLYRGFVRVTNRRTWLISVTRTHPRTQALADWIANVQVSTGPMRTQLPKLGFVQNLQYSKTEKNFRA